MKKLAIANGKYQKDGVEKTRWVNIGVIGVGSNGKEYMMLDPTINLAGFARDAGRDMVMVSIFDDSQQGQQFNSQPTGQNAPTHYEQAPQQQQQYQPQQQQAQQPMQQQAQQPMQAQTEIPF